MTSRFLALRSDGNSSAEGSFHGRHSLAGSWQLQQPGKVYGGRSFAQGKIAAHWSVGQASTASQALQLVSRGIHAHSSGRKPPAKWKPKITKRPPRTLSCTPAAASCSMAGAAVSLGGSKKARYPRNTKSLSSLTEKSIWGLRTVFIATPRTRSPCRCSVLPVSSSTATIGFDALPRSCSPGGCSACQSCTTIQLPSNAGAVGTA